ncbi:MAG: redoxin domain-containing protein [Gammaproteobacteria bacterium]|nr:redoxin domain-containing protein [Gammaproteobacteria bacterium]
MFKNLFIQAVFFVVVFLLISWFRESSLLPTDGEYALPEVTVERLSGQTVPLAQYSGKPTLYYFWAPWCSVCKLSMPNLQEFHESQMSKPEAERINVVSVALSYDSKQEVIDYVVDRKYQFTTVLGNVETGAAFKIKGFPTYYFVDENGCLVSKSMGYSTELGMFLRSLTL